jgi:hypothetical protein
VALTPEKVQREMRERGVLPDLAWPVEPADADDGQSLLIWRVASSPAIWLPKLDAVATDCLQPEDGAARRWLRLAPRYLGRMAQGVRVLRCNEESAQRFQEQVRVRVESGEIGVAVAVQSVSPTAASMRAQRSLTP